MCPGDLDLLILICLRDCIKSYALCFVCHEWLWRLETGDSWRRARYVLEMWCNWPRSQPWNQHTVHLSLNCVHGGCTESALPACTARTNTVANGT
jgi:hypothetical protein